MREIESLEIDDFETPSGTDEFEPGDEKARTLDPETATKLRELAQWQSQLEKLTASAITNHSSDNAKLIEELTNKIAARKQELNIQN